MDATEKEKKTSGQRTPHRCPEDDADAANKHVKGLATPSVPREPQRKVARSEDGAPAGRPSIKSQGGEDEENAGPADSAAGKGNCPAPAETHALFPQKLNLQPSEGAGTALGTWQRNGRVSTRRLVCKPAQERSSRRGAVG